MQDEYAHIAHLYATILDPILSRARRTAREMVRGLGASTALDICCGTGALCRDLAADGMAMTGVDLSNAMLDQARRRSLPSQPVDYLWADARTLPFEPEAFDVCTLSLCLHENDPEDRPRVLAEALRVGRRVVVVDYTGQPGPLGLAAHLPERLAGRRHYAAFCDFMDRGGAEGLLEASGCEVLARDRVLLGVGVCALARPAPV